MDARRFLDEVDNEIRARFAREKALLSFEGYLEAFAAAPRAHSRGAAAYLCDVFDHFGTRALEAPVGPALRYRLFDAEVAGDEGEVAGHAEVQAQLYRALRTFARQGRIDRLILLHGPNGSAKSSLVSAVMRGMERYSLEEAGAVYRFNWIFPRERLVKGSMGFGGGPTRSESTSFAHLEAEDIEARLSDPLRDHPLLLIPRPQRERLLRSACEPAEPGEAGEGDFVLPRYLLEGDLSLRNRAIFDALLASYGGDWHRVMAHVQVERFYFSREYQQGCVTIEPQMSVDASVRALNVDRSALALPPALQSTTLIEPFGPLVSANRGLLEFSDLLKRPLEAFKYLLGTSETGEVRMEHLNLRLDTVLMATTNELHLSAFKELPDFSSFKGRMELIRVPYLRRLSEERQIYEARVTPASLGRPIAPHAIEVAAMWAVLTRLKLPQAERYPAPARELVAALSPLEKLRLYDRAEVPQGLPGPAAKELRAHLKALYQESATYPNYEGRAGASARELRGVLMNAAQREGHESLTPGAVLDSLRELVREESVYDFLRQDRAGPYHAHAELVDVVEEAWLDEVDDEVREAAGLISELQFSEWFERYIQHVIAWVQEGTVRNPATGEREPPSAALLDELEAIVRPADEDPESFRKGLISTIGAHHLDNPSDAGELDFPRIFPGLFQRLADHYHEEQRRTLSRIYRDFLRYTDPGERAGLDRRALAQVEEMLATLKGRYGYQDDSAKEALLALMRRRYADLA